LHQPLTTPQSARIDQAEKVTLSAVGQILPESLTKVKDGGVAHRYRARDGTQHVHQPAQTKKDELKKELR
jgi:hypothetical protein